MLQLLQSGLKFAMVLRITLKFWSWVLGYSHMLPHFSLWGWCSGIINSFTYTHRQSLKVLYSSILFYVEIKKFQKVKFKSWCMAYQPAGRLIFMYSRGQRLLRWQTPSSHIYNCREPSSEVERTQTESCKGQQYVSRQDTRSDQIRGTWPLWWLSGRRHLLCKPDAVS